MENLAEFVKRAAVNLNCQRVRFTDKNLPTQPSDIIVFPFFGDIRSSHLLSSFLLKRYKEKSSKYVILCSWPGFQNLYPYVDEYWTLSDQAVVKSLAISANNFFNTGEIATVFKRKLNEWFEKVVGAEDFLKYYENGFQEDFWKSFSDLKLFLPNVPSEMALPESFRTQFLLKKGKVLIYPTTSVRSWQFKECVNEPISYGFWEYLCNRMIDANLMPVVYINPFTFDLSKTLADKCIFFVPNEISQLLSIMRLTGCVLDVYSGISRLALSARCPFVSVDERERYVSHRDNEIDSLCADVLPHDYIFSYSSMITKGNESNWNINLVTLLLNKINDFLPTLNRDDWPSVDEAEKLLDYNKVLVRRGKKLGVHFLAKAKDK